MQVYRMVSFCDLCFMYIFGTLSLLFLAALSFLVFLSFSHLVLQVIVLIHDLYLPLYFEIRYSRCPLLCV